MRLLKALSHPIPTPPLLSPRCCGTNTRSERGMPSEAGRGSKAKARYPTKRYYASFNSEPGPQGPRRSNSRTHGYQAV
eukprot:366049-Chlamydomonas_euryale.AAC.3